jgi:hypothetical protein
MGMNSLNRTTDNKLCKVAHGGAEEMGVPRFRYIGTGTPEIAVQNGHQYGDGPSKKDFAVTANTFVGDNAICAFNQAHPNAEQSFVDAEVATNGAAIKYIKDQSAEVEGMMIY